MRDIAALIAVVFLLASCAGILPVPGGSETVNEPCFKSEEEMKGYIAGLSPGMDDKSVLAGLCQKADNLIRLDRREIRIALLGDAAITLAGDPDVIQKLCGYRINFESIRRKHGFSSPIRVKTDEQGYSYSVTLIFFDGKLFGEPILSGGDISRSSTRTLFDYLTPGTVIDQVR